MLLLGPCRPPKRGVCAIRRAALAQIVGGLPSRTFPDRNALSTDYCATSRLVAAIDDAALIPSFRCSLWTFSHNALRAVPLRACGLLELLFQLRCCRLCMDCLLPLVLQATRRDQFEFEQRNVL